jgi:hypothetical protein
MLAEKGGLNEEDACGLGSYREGVKEALKEVGLGVHILGCCTEILF